MIRRGLSPTAMIIGLVGLALIGFETVQGLRSVAINTVGTALIFVGVGLFVVAAVLVVVGFVTFEGSGED